MQAQPSTGCVINGGTHTHVYGAYHAEQQANLDELSANVTNLSDMVHRLTRLVAHCCKMHQPEPEPEPTYEPPANMYTAKTESESESESESECESEPDYKLDLEESDTVDPDQQFQRSKPDCSRNSRISAARGHS